MKKESRNLIIAGIFAILGIVLLATIVSATNPPILLCLSKGEKVEFSKCNPNMNDYTCSSTACFQCATEPSPGIFCPANPNACNHQNLQCNTGNATNNTIDAQDPNITIKSPLNGGIYNKKTLFFTVFLDERANLYYINTESSDGRLNQLCKACTSFNRTFSFKEGANNLTIRAADFSGNIGLKNFSFFIDSTKPRISRVSPKIGSFASGEFEINFQELNPKTLTLIYGNVSLGLQSHAINLHNDCVNTTKDKYSCITDVDLSSYNGKNIVYWFNLTDVGGNSLASKASKIVVDTQSPVITSFTSNLTAKTLTIVINITEKNFDSVDYIDNSAIVPKWTTFCSSLSKGICKKSVTLKSGTHSFDFQVNDDAGNAVAVHRDVIVP